MRRLILLLAFVAACNDRTTTGPIGPITTRDLKASFDVTQSSAPWHLDRIDQTAAKLNGTYGYWTSAGGGANIYIIDSGIRATHVDFTGRIGTGHDFVGDGQGTNDCFGHGTEMAGFAAGTTYGAAKLATIIPLRVINCSGAANGDSVLSAISWVIANGVHPGVINLSLSGSRDSVTDAKIIEAQNAGFLVVAAAGNGVGQDACNFAGAVAFTVGSVIHSSQGHGSDAIYVQSNVGPCVEIFAPSEITTSDYYTSDTATLSALSGTSNAAALTSGAAALYLAEHPTASVATVAAYLVSTGTAGALNNVPVGTVNLLLRTHNGNP